MTNQERYKTPEERYDEFYKYCKSKSCYDCPLRPSGYSSRMNGNAYCALKWLDLKSEEDDLVPCKRCGREAIIVHPWTADGCSVMCKKCGVFVWAHNQAEAIDMWNGRDEMITCSSFTWPDVAAIAMVFGSCVASIMIFAKNSGGRK